MVIKTIKNMIKKAKEYLYIKHIQYPEMDLATLIQLREWLNEEIAVRVVQHKSVKEVRKLATVVTARIMEKQREERDGEE